MIAVVLFVVYLLSLVFSLRTHRTCTRRASRTGGARTTPVAVPRPLACCGGHGAGGVDERAARRLGRERLAASG